MRAQVWDSPDVDEQMRSLSEILIENHDIETFAGLVRAIRAYATRERFLRMDIKPPYPDTPENWEDVLEAAFTGVARDEE